MSSQPNLSFSPDEEKKSLWNPLQGGGRGKAWAEDAKAKISYFKIRLETTKARIQITEADAELKDGRPATAKEDATKSPAERFLSRVLPLRYKAAPAPAERSTVEELDVTCVLVNELLSRAQAAAEGIAPRYRPFWGWWSGAGIEAAYRNLHCAEAAISRFYSKDEVRAETPEVVRRVRAALAEDDPTRSSAAGLLGPDDSVIKICQPEQLSALISLGHEAADRNRAKLRTFRNVVLVGSLLMLILLGVVVMLSARWPSLIPLCFTQDPPPSPPTAAVACPTGEGGSISQPSGGSRLEIRGPTPWDVPIVALLGLVGGALSVAVFIRGMYANSTPYNVSVPLSLLKLPVAAISAIVGMILVGGDFVPGFSAIDKQGQILAYAVVFGFSQQLFTKTVDRRAENLIANLPTSVKREDAPAQRQAQR